MPFFSLGPEGRRQFEQFGRVSTLGLELGLSIALGYWAGQWLDRKLGTTWLTWLGFGFGLAAGTRSLVVLVRRTRAELSQDSPDGSPPASHDSQLDSSETDPP